MSASLRQNTYDQQGISIEVDPLLVRNLVLALNHNTIRAEPNHRKGIVTQVVLLITKADRE